MNDDPPVACVRSREHSRSKVKRREAGQCCPHLPRFVGRSPSLIVPGNAYVGAGR
ncbi:MAG: hypothetical protein NTV43_18220 [Methylococcales bacterium]|nr:hypothetical protein [Methylococcales bacterium]